MSAKSASKKRDDLLALPFVKDDPAWARPGERGPRCFWSVKTTGSIQADCDLGQEYARAALDYMYEIDRGPILGYIARDFAQQPQCYEGDDKMIMIGFMAEIARSAMFGRHVLKAMEQEVEERGRIVLYKVQLDPSEPLEVCGIKRPLPFPHVEIRNPVS